MLSPSTDRPRRNAAHATVGCRHVRSRILSSIALVAALIGLGASIASLIDFAGAAPRFCAESGCATVRESAWSHPLGIPMPVLGIAYFTATSVLAFVSRPRLRMLLAIVGGAWAVALIAVQAFAIHSWCTLCLVADPSAIVGAFAVIGGARTVRCSWPRVAGTVPAVAAVVLALGLVAHVPAVPAEVPPGTPEVIAQAQVPGEIAIVEFIDFECPFCRELAPKLEAAIAKAMADGTAPVRVVRKMVPLAKHPHAMAAALAWCCADAQGKGDQMAKALFEVEPDELTPEGCEQIAARVGCDLAKYRAQIADPALAKRIAQDVADARAAGVAGFPTVFIGDARVSGAAHTVDELAMLIRHARSNR